MLNPNRNYFKDQNVVNSELKVTARKSFEPGKNGHPMLKQIPDKINEEAE